MDRVRQPGGLYRRQFGAELWRGVHRGAHRRIGAPQLQDNPFRLQLAYPLCEAFRIWQLRGTVLFVAKEFETWPEHGSRSRTILLPT
jgi:hypothetical protein